MIPSSFSTVCTSNCAFELIGLLLSLSIYHKDANIYIIADTKTKNIIEEMTPQPKLNIIWVIELDKYDGLNRNSMEKMNIWSDFQMSKALIIKKALDIEKDTLLLDSDIIILDEINDIDNTKELGISPQFLPKIQSDRWGYYNGGVLWTNSKKVADDWIKYTKTSRYYDQASIEDLAKIYKYFEFGENYNLQSWRHIHCGPEKIESYISINDNKIMYKDKPLKFIHTHFRDSTFSRFNNVLIKHINKLKLYKILLIIYRVINDKWIFKIPMQPMDGIGHHLNDSFRELVQLIEKHNKDVDIVYVNDSIHCWLNPNISLYDRPTLEWYDEQLNISSLLLLGNGDINIEGKLLNNKIKNIRPWIFWPRRPSILEKIIDEKGILNYKERSIESIFIGNFENAVQEKHRNNNKWDTVLDEYHSTKGGKHKFTNEEYLMKLRNSKFGLCLRGYGSKCHREVELMGFGTVPIVTPGVSIDSYMDPLIENKHYISVKDVDDFKEKLSKINENKWNQMSKECYEWYQKNVYSKNCWENMIKNILYIN